MSVEIELIGGPADGTLIAVPTDVHGRPPATLDLLEMDLWDVKTVHYLRELNQKDSGPLWLYRRQACCPFKNPT